MVRRAHRIGRYSRGNALTCIDARTREGQFMRAIPSSAFDRGGGGGGTSVVIHQNFALGLQGAVRAEMAAALPQMIALASDEVMRRIRLGGEEARIVGVRR